MKPRNHSCQCPAETAFDCIGGRWKALIVWYIGGGVARYSDIKTNLPKITPHMLSLQLRALEEDDLNSRTQYEEIPPRVECRLTRAALALPPFLTRCVTGRFYTILNIFPQISSNALPANPHAERAAHPAQQTHPEPTRARPGRGCQTPENYLTFLSRCICNTIK
ncbi:MAG: helix-turn-helix transcriptional regulator, partial [Methanocorpusculum sp.]|nr:helix-turn-helix transcriptional regulator [Methanocorpusculum sp.]